MTRLDEPVGLADRLSAALLTARAHKDHRRCLNCPPEGPCGVEWWALKERERHPGFHRLRTDSPSDQTT